MTSSTSPRPISVAWLRVSRKHSPAENRINFGMRRIKWLIAMMHWCQVYQCCSKEPDIADFSNADAFKEALQVSTQRALLRKNDSHQVDMISKAADPGKFKDEKKWTDWEPAFVNYLSTIPGVKGIPQSYVVCTTEDPEHEINFEGDFMTRSIACTPSMMQHSMPRPERFTSYL